MSKAFSGENPQVLEQQVAELSDVLAETLKKEYELIQGTDNVLGIDDRKRFAEVIAGILHQDPPAEAPLVRHHRILNANIEDIKPPLDAPGLEHLAFIETMLVTQQKATPNPLTPEDHREEVGISLERSLRRIQRLKEAGRILVSEWRGSQGQHFIARRPGEWMMGVIKEEPSTALYMDYGDPQAITSDFADWLLGVNDNYLNLTLGYRGTGEAIASFQFEDTQRLVESLGVLYARYLSSRFDLGDSVHIPGNKTGDVLIGDSALRNLLGRLKLVDAINPFIKLSSPEIAAPILWPLIVTASHADIAHIVKQVQIHHETGKGKERRLSEDGRKWLTGLGITG